MGSTSNDVDMDEEPIISVLVAGAGPAGLMLATNLTRFGVDVDIVDDRPTKTTTGRADGLQPKSIETLKQMRLAEPLLRRGVKIYDICFWNATSTSKLSRTNRDIHYPKDKVDTLDPYVLLVHQGMVEDIFLQDLSARGVHVNRSQPFIECKTNASGLVETLCIDDDRGLMRKVQSKYVVGCDGAHSRVRRSIPGVTMAGESGKAAWGVLDAVLDTDFPDIWSKTAVHSEEAGAMMIIPRERNMTRLYVELHPEGTLTADKIENQEFVMRRAQEILFPFKLNYKAIEWFSVYRVGQRVASKFSHEQKIFIAGDAAHTHSPKAAQGMNVSMHDALNLAWKLNLAVRDLALPSLLETYETERKQIAQELIEFDYEHANAFLAGDAAALAKNFDDNIRFISGIGAEYKPNILNVHPNPGEDLGALAPGKLLPPAKVQRYIDANPVDFQLDIPMLGQFRMYFFVPDIKAPLLNSCLTKLCSFLDGQESILGRAMKAANKSYQMMPAKESEETSFEQSGRYVEVSHLITFGLVTTMPKENIEIADLPPILQASRWTFYLDDVDGVAGKCTEKYLAGLADNEMAVVIVRPDGYVGTVNRWLVSTEGLAEEAGKAWLEGYFGGFLKD